MAQSPSKKTPSKKAAAQKAAAKKSAGKKAGAKKTRAKKAAPQPPPPFPEAAVLQAFMDEIASAGWADLSLAAVAGRAEVDPSELERRYATKTSLLRAFQDMVDEQVMAAVDPEDQDESTRDRLFDLLMQRFDVLAPYKEGLARLSRELISDPIALVGWGARLKRSMAWVLSASGGPSDSCLGRVHTDGLTALWLATARVWLQDDTPDLTKTMAALDKNLARAEQAANQLAQLPWRRGAAA